MAVAAALTAAGWLFPLDAPTQDVVLSEFMARNDSTLLDEDGEYSDWAELYNGTAEPVNLAGWHLSDDASDFSKWALPTVLLGPFEYRIVFLSGKDRASPTGSLHANFKLNGDGEFFALIRPDGEIASVFSPSFPRQLVDQSYGFAHDFVNVVELVAPGAIGKVLIPQDDSQALDWVDPEFDDGSWGEGQSGFGFDQTARPSYEEFILTDIGAEMRNVNAGAYVRIPFELADATMVHFLRLEMLYEDGFIVYVNGVEIARSNAPDVPRWDSESTAVRPAKDAVVVQEFDVSPAKGALRSGSNVLAIHGLNRSAENSDFFVLPELTAFGVAPISELRRYFDAPSPGWPNGPGFEAASEEPQLSPPGGVYADRVLVEIKAPTPDSEVRYTLDGSTPERTSTLYTSPIEIESNLQLLARSFTPERLPSGPVGGRYVFMTGNIAHFTSDLPIFVVSTFGETIDEWVPAHFHVVDREQNGRALLSSGAQVEFSGIGQIKSRGSSTGGRQKQSYSLELWEAEDDAVDVELLGLPAESDWVLYGPYNFDRANIRNPLVYALSNQIGLYAPRTRFVEVFVNRSNTPLSESHYFGLYVLTEKIKQGEDRVDVERLDPEDGAEPEVSGGYIVKIDRADPGDEGFFGGSQALKHVYPKEGEITPAQKTWLVDYLNQFNTALRGPNAADPILGYEAFIDVDSFIDHHLLNEFTKNPDHVNLSTYFNKPRNGKFRAGPVWDFDRTLGSDDDLRSADPEGWTGARRSSWWGGLFGDPGFERRYRARWKELREGVMSTANILGVIDSMADEIREAQARNFEKWTNLVNGTPGWQREIQQLKTWITQRVRWMDTEFLEIPEYSIPGGIVTPPVEIELGNPNGSGEIVYTLNGPDPRLANGSLAPEALVYDGPIAITENVRIRARVQIERDVWSEINEEFFIVTIPSLAITEVMYNPPGGSSAEFLEFLNHGDAPLSLTGLSITTAVTFDFGDEFLQPDEYLLVVKDMDGFAERYSTQGSRIAGVYGGTLRNRGETIDLVGPLGETIVSLSYEDEWHPETDGLGHSLVLLDPKSSPASWSEASSWRPSLEVNGSPGREDPTELPSGRQKPGDINQDGSLNLVDTTALLSALFSGNTSLPCGDGSPQHAANVAFLDANGDLSVNLTDAIYTLTYLFLRGPAPIQGRQCIEVAGCPDVCE